MAVVTPQRSHFAIEPRGPFSLREAAMFGFGQRHDTTFDVTMRLAFCVDGYQSQAGVAVTQEPGEAGVVHLAVAGRPGGADLEAVGAQVARVLSLDHDASGFVALGAHDPVIAGLLAAAPGLRPPLFYSPYEAAFWAVLSARRNRRTAETWRRRIASIGGTPFDVAGVEMWPLPLPSEILASGAAGLVEAAGIEPARAERLCGVATAALEGRLDAEPLAAMDPDAARRVLQSVPGIGPFYADLVLVRSTGVTDVVSVREPMLLGLVGQLWGLGRPATPEELEERARAWVPWRTWTSVLIRAAGPRVLENAQSAMDR